jgi:hypothetical protein
MWPTCMRSRQSSIAPFYSLFWFHQIITAFDLDAVLLSSCCCCALLYLHFSVHHLLLARLNFHMRLPGPIA